MTLDDMILDWNTLREQHPDEDSRDYFDFVEEKVAESELTQSCTTEIVAGRPLNETELARLEELIDELDEEPGNTVAVSFTEYIDDDSVDSVKIRKSGNGYSMQLAINMEDFDWEEPLILAAEKISRPDLNALINELFRDGKTTDEIEYIMEHFVQIKNNKKDEEEK